MSTINYRSTTVFCTFLADTNRLMWEKPVDAYQVADSGRPWGASQFPTHIGGNLRKPPYWLGLIYVHVRPRLRSPKYHPGGWGAVPARVDQAVRITRVAVANALASGRRSPCSVHVHLPTKWKTSKLIISINSLPNYIKMKGNSILTCLFGTYTCLSSVHTHAPKLSLVLA